MSNLFGKKELRKTFPCIESETKVPAKKNVSKYRVGNKSGHLTARQTGTLNKTYELTWVRMTNGIQERQKIDFARISGAKTCEDLRWIWLFLVRKREGFITFFIYRLPVVNTCSKVSTTLGVTLSYVKTTLASDKALSISPQSFHAAVLTLLNVNELAVGQIIVWTLRRVNALAVSTTPQCQQINCIDRSSVSVTLECQRFCCVMHPQCQQLLSVNVSAVWQYSVSLTRHGTTMQCQKLFSVNDFTVSVTLLSFTRSVDDTLSICTCPFTWDVCREKKKLEVKYFIFCHFIVFWNFPILCRFCEQISGLIET
jgi:hypothetical protein